MWIAGVSVRQQLLVFFIRQMMTAKRTAERQSRALSSIPDASRSGVKAKRLPVRLTAGRAAGPRANPSPIGVGRLDLPPTAVSLTGMDRRCDGGGE